MQLCIIAGWGETTTGDLSRQLRFLSSRTLCYCCSTDTFVIFTVNIRSDQFRGSFMNFLDKLFGYTGCTSTIGAAHIFRLGTHGADQFAKVPNCSQRTLDWWNAHLSCDPVSLTHRRSWQSTLSEWAKAGPVCVLPDGDGAGGPAQKLRDTVLVRRHA